MRCVGCGTENRPGRRFCARCGAALAAACPSCKFVNEPSDEFCGGCGHPLTLAAPGSASPAGALPLTPSAERRQLTVLFCDLVGSTELSVRMDPEELRDTIRAYQAASGDAIRRYDGYVAQYLGDGLLVYFGYPAAHEDDAKRAVRAALGIVEAIRELSERGSVGLAVRVGIHTGLVVVGEMGERDRREQLALGETPNVAARLQALAEPGSVVISGASHKLVQRAFACEDLGLHAIKGIAAPVPAYQVLGEIGAAEHASAPPIALGPLVGRDPQVNVLRERWESAARGFGQVVLISGEAGIGKSRLLETVREHASGVPHTRLEASCSPYHEASPLYAVSQLLSAAAAFSPDDPADERLRRLEELVAALALPAAESLPLLVSLLGLPAQRYPLPAWTPQRVKQKTIESVLLAVRALAARQPLLLVVEDLHWVDASTLELLTLLVEQVATAPICALFTARTEFSPPWAARAHSSQLMLDRLPRREAESIVLAVAGGKALPAEVLRVILARTVGVPLFVEELTKMVLESELLRLREDRYELSGPLPPLAIPTTLQDSLMSRLDRLATVKVVAQLGAVLGREFSYALLEAVARMEPATLEQELARLVDAEIVYQRGVPPDATYIFKHALIQEAAYQSLLKSARQEYHRGAAQALEERFGEVATSQPEIVARHYTEAGLVEQAIPLWRRSGENAARRSANAEAIAHFERALALVPMLPDTLGRTRLELALLMALGPVLFGSRGFAAPETEQVYRRAEEICALLGDTPEVFPALWGRWGFFSAQGDVIRAFEIGEQLLAHARRAGDPALLLEARHARWPTRFCSGEFVAVLEDFAEASALYDPDRHPALAFAYGGHDAGVCGLAFESLTRWVLGSPQLALERGRQALELARRLNHPHSTVIADVFVALLNRLHGDLDGARARAEAARALAAEYGSPQWGGLATVVLGSTRAALGEIAAGLGEMRQGLAEWRATRAELFLPMTLGLIAEAELAHGEVEAARSLIHDALARVEVYGERFYEAELHRLRGELRLANKAPDPRGAEQSFERAIQVARQQQARSWELRAASSLARLWQSQGRRERAGRLLAEATAGFTEELETPDLRDAHALLAELDGAARSR